MGFYKYCRVFLFVISMVTCWARCDAARRQLRFSKSPSGGHLDGLGCAIERHLTTRGVKFDTRTATCDALTEDWFRNQTEEPGNNYFRLVMAELALEPTTDLNTSIPENFVVGTSVVAYLKTKEAPNRFIVDFKRSGIYALHFIIRYSNVMVYNNKNGPWGKEEYSPNYFTSPNTVYKLEVIIKETVAEIKVDDTLIHSFYQRNPIEDYRILRFRGYPMLLERLEYFYPTEPDDYNTI